MNDFIKTAMPHISGLQKAAILLGELDRDASSAVFACLHLSDSERKMLVSAFKRLGQYNSRDERQVLRENAVLQEALDYGAARRIFIAPRKGAGKTGAVRSSGDIAHMAKTDPDAVAKIIKNWLET
ncbi:hypothetical protein [Treponema socranskii]|uniref:hypothetical protein n=1 Tax=Treponema socranskii TaxID=53419 RepID=UPI0028E1D20C|nr:hypothetical protein [Treponema socranskii]